MNKIKENATKKLIVNPQEDCLRTVLKRCKRYLDKYGRFEGDCFDGNFEVYVFCLY